MSPRVTSVSEPKLGGMRRLTVFAKAGDDVADALLPGRKTDAGLSDVLYREHDARDVSSLHEPCGPCTALLRELQADTPGRLIEARPDVVVLSLSSDLATDLEEFDRTIPNVIRALKDEVGAHVLVFNCSSVDPADTTINYYRAPESPSMRIHRLNLRLIELSIEEGISIIDADRIIGELGARDHLGGFLDYSGEACRALAHEVARVLADYGFFERRPLVPQLGARKAMA